MRGIPHLGMVSVSQSTPIGLLHMALLTKQIRRSVLSRMESTGSVDSMLSRIQNDLFDVGADLCTPHQEKPKYPPLRIAQKQVDRLESEIDAMNEKLTSLSSFILPGGTKLAALLHNARTVTRRAEREIVLLASHENINSLAVKYVNRLSDHLFVFGSSCK